MRVCDPLHPVRRLGLQAEAGSFAHLSGPGWTIGEFYCLPSAPDFSVRAAPARGFLIALPRLPVGIEKRDQGPIVADPTGAVCYNPDDEYRRRQVGELGDHCFWLLLSDTVAREAIRSCAPGAADERRPITFTRAPLAAAERLQATTLIHAMIRGEAPDPLEADERVRTLAGAIFATGFQRPSRRDRPGERRALAAHRAAVYEAQAFLAHRCRRAITLDDVAVAAGVSVHHLCRLFRESTGMTIHAYRNRLRLRIAEEAIREGCRDLTRLALDTGFASHSHFTDAFRSEFGVPPSAIRGSSKIPEAVSPSAWHSHGDNRPLGPASHRQ